MNKHKLRGKILKIRKKNSNKNLEINLSKFFSLLKRNKLKVLQMAKVSMVQRDLKRRKLYSKYKNKREKLLITAKDKSLSAEDRFEARLKLAQLPRNSSKNRIRNRCLITGRPRGVYRKFGLSRIAFRDLASDGKLPGVVKSSW